MIWLIYLSLSYDVEICLCQANECFDYCKGENGHVIDTKELDNYDKFTNSLIMMLGRHKSVLINIISDDLLIEIDLSFFINREIKISSPSSMKTPEKLVLFYSTNLNYSDTSVELEFLNVCLYNTNSSKDIIDLNFKFLNYGAYADQKLELYPNNVEYRLITNSFILPIEVCSIISNIICIGTDELCTITFDAENSYYIEMLPNSCIISYEQKRIEISCDNRYEIKLDSYIYLSSQIEIFNKENIKNSPKISVENFNLIIISGNWSEYLLFNYNLGIINSMAMQYSPSIVVNSEDVPFEIICSKLELHLSRSTNVKSNIKSDECLIYSNSDIVDIRISLWFEKIEGSRISIFSANIDIIISSYYQSKLPALTLPFEIAISDEMVSTVTLYSYIFIIGYPINTFEYINIRNLATKNPDDAYFMKLFELGAIIKIPSVLEKYIAAYPIIKYTDDSNNIYGLNNNNNMLVLKCVKVFIEMHISFELVITSLIPRTLCYGNNCTISNSINDLSTDLPNFVIKTTKQYHILLNSPLNGINEIVINFQGINISDCSFSIIDNYNYKINFLFPESKIIKTLLLENIDILSSNNILVDELVLKNYRHENANEISLYCDSVDLDHDSIVFCERISGKILKLIIQSVEEIFLGDNQIWINNISFPEAFLQNCTFIAGSSLDLNANGSCEIHGLNIITLLDLTITWKGNWNDVTTTNGININLCKHKSLIVLKTNKIYKDINYFDGTTYFEIDYIDTQEICIYKNDLSLCSYVDKKIDYKDFDVSALTSDGINIYLVEFNEEPFETDLSLFNKKQVKFSNILSNNITQKVQIKMSSEIDINLTSYTFQNIEISQKEEQNLKFGFLKIISSSFNGFNNVEMAVARFSCDFDNLGSFNSLLITNELIVDGNFSSNESRVFLNSGSSLHISIYEDISLKYQQLSLIVGDTSFIFFSQDSNIDILIKSDINLEIISEMEVKAIKTKIYNKYNNRIDILGSWNIEEKSFDIISESTFTLGVENTVPIDIKCLSKIKVEAMSKNCKIIGKLNNIISVYSFNDTDTVISIDAIVIDAFVGDEINVIHVASPYVDLIVQSISSSISNSFKINFIVAFNEIKPGSLTVVDPFPDNIKFSATSIFIESLIYGELKSNEEYPILFGFYVFIRVTATLYDYSYPQYYNDSPNLTHGFNRNSNVVNIMQGIGQIVTIMSMNFFYMPSEILYSIAYTENNLNAELVIHDAKDLAKMFDMVSENINSIQIIINKPMTIDFPIPFSHFQNRKTSLSVIIFGNENDIYIDQICPCIKTFKIFYSKTYFLSNIQISNLEMLAFQDVELNGNLIIENNNDKFSCDVKSYSKILSMYPNWNNNFKSFEIINSNYITFTEDGWIFQDDIYGNMIKINKSEDNEIIVEAASCVFLMIEKPRIQTKIHGLSIFLSSTTDEFYHITTGPGWGRIKNYYDIQVIYQQSDIISVLLCDDYPYPDIFGDQLLAVELNPYSNSDKWLQDDFEASLYNKFMLDSFNIEKAVIYGDKIILSIFCHFSLYLNYGRFVVKTVEVEEYSIGELYTFDITEKIIMNINTLLALSLPGSFEETSITMYWDTNVFPLLAFLDKIDEKNIPKNIDIILVEKSPDYEEYYEYLYKKSFTIINGEFNCYEWNKKIHFRSNDAFFNDSSKLIFTTQCVRDKLTNIFELVITGTNPLPLPISNKTDSSVDETKGLSKNSTIILASGIVVVVLILFGIVIYYFTKLKYEKLMSLRKSLSASYSTSEQTLRNEAYKVEEVTRDLENIEEESYFEEESYAEEEDLDQITEIL